MSEFQNSTNICPEVWTTVLFSHVADYGNYLSSKMFHEYGLEIHAGITPYADRSFHKNGKHILDDVLSEGIDLLKSLGFRSVNGGYLLDIEHSRFSINEDDFSSDIFNEIVLLYRRQNPLGVVRYRSDVVNGQFVLFKSIDERGHFQKMYRQLEFEVGEDLRRQEILEREASDRKLIELLQLTIMNR